MLTSVHFSATMNPICSPAITVAVSIPSCPPGGPFPQTTAGESGESMGRLATKGGTKREPVPSRTYWNCLDTVLLIMRRGKQSVQRK